MKLLIKYILVILFLFVLQDAHAQYPDDQNLFGKNRLQFRHFEWKFVKTRHFEIYYFDPYRSLANTTAKLAEEEYIGLSSTLGFSPYARLKIFVYPNIMSSLQSNRGINEQDFQVGGQTNFSGSVIEIAYSGIQQEFKKLLKEEITRNMLLEMMYGGNLKDILQSTYLLSLPEWFLDGAAHHIAYGMESDEVSDYVRNALYTRSLEQPEKLTGEEAKLMGASIWNYIEVKYGRSVLSNILNLTRIVRSERTAIKNSLGVSYESFLKKWQAHYRQELVAVQKKHVHLPKDSTLSQYHQHRYLNDVSLSPDGEQVAWTENNNGRCKVLLKSKNKTKPKTIFKSAYRVFNQRFEKNVPLVHWDKSGIHLIYAKNNQFEIIQLDHNGKVKENPKTIPHFLNIIDFKIHENGDLLLIGQKKTDQHLRVYAGTPERLQALSPDEYDVKSATWAGKNNQELYFVSDKLSSPQQIGFGDAFNLFRLKNDSITAMTAQIADIDQVLTLDQGHLMFTSNMTGIRQIYRFDLQKETAIQVSHWITGVQQFDFKNNRLAIIARNETLNQAFAFNWKGKEQYFTGKTPRRQWLDLQRLQRFNRNKRLDEEIKVKLSLDSLNQNKAAESSPAEKKDSTNKNSDYDFSTFKVKKRKRLLKNFDYYANQKKDSLLISKSQRYENRFSFDQSLISFAFDPIRDFGLLFEAGMSDALEHHKFNAGLFNIGLFNLQNGVLFAEYQYLENRLDYIFRFDRRSISFFPAFYLQKYSYNRFKTSFSYPLNVSNRLVVSPYALMTSFDVTSDLDPAIQQYPSSYVSYAGIELSAVHDHSLVIGPNIREGGRLSANLEMNYSPGNSNKNFGRFMLDARYYKPLTRGLHFAGRFSYGHSFGASPKIFRIGGVDNWINREDLNDAPYTIDETDPESYKNDYSDFLFVRYATPLRGFEYNKLFGSNFMLFNAELRMPLIDFISSSAVQSRFVQNFQFIGFLDVGSAWTGISPFNRENALNTVEIGGEAGNPFFAKVSNFKDPFLMGYGFGMRSKLLSYFIKLDIAWGLEDGTVGDTRYQLSIGYDF